MADDDLATPYKIAPGTPVRIESLYEGDNRLLGAMGLMIITVADTTPCPRSGPYGVHGFPGYRHSAVDGAQLLCCLLLPLRVCTGSGFRHRRCITMMAMWSCCGVGAFTMRAVCLSALCWFKDAGLKMLGECGWWLRRPRVLDMAIEVVYCVDDRVGVASGASRWDHERWSGNAGSAVAGEACHSGGACCA